MRFVCELSCDVACVDFVYLCVRWLCVMLHGLISFLFGGAVFVCVIVTACVLFTIFCVVLAELCCVRVLG